MKTFVEILRERAQHEPDGCAFAFLSSGGVETRLTYAQLERRARALAHRLQQAGAAREPVLILLQPGLDFVVAVFGCLFAGCIMTPCAVPRRVDRAGQFRAIAGDSGAKFAIGCPPFPDDPDFPPFQWIAPDTENSAESDLWREPALQPGEIALLQYTSGSTGAPRGVMISHANLFANAVALQEAFHLPRLEWVVTWLPPFHDMGLMGNIMHPVFVGAPNAVIAPVEFARRPALWLQTMSRYRARTSGGPNFAYDYCARSITEEESAGLCLDSWKVAYVGAEPVRAATMNLFARRFAPNGFRRESFFPCYGLAEATLFVSGGHANVTHLSAAAVRSHRVVETSEKDPDAASFVSCGRPAASLQVTIVDPETGLRSAQDAIGEISLSGPTIARGYWNTLDDPASHPGHLRTGDLGFLRGGELFVTGRSKDLIIVRGRNHYPQDIENTVAGLSGAIRPGSCAVFSVEIETDEKVVCLLEMPRPRPANPAVLAGDIREAVARTHELRVSSVMLVAPGAIPRTSSGKVRRLECRAQYLAGALQGLAF